MQVIHANFTEKRVLTEEEIEDKISDEAGIMQDPIIRMSRAITSYNRRVIKEILSENH